MCDEIEIASSLKRHLAKEAAGTLDDYERFRQAVSDLYRATNGASSFGEAFECLNEPDHNHFYNASLSVHLYTLQSAVENGLAQVFGSPLLALPEDADDDPDWD